MSVELDKVANLVEGPAINSFEIDGIYACQLEHEPPIQTLSTTALLVTSEILPVDLTHSITKAIFEESAFLQLEKNAMARAVDSVPLHPGAISYYKEEGYLPTKDSKFFTLTTFLLNNFWRALAILVIVAAGFKGLFELRRTHTSNAFCRRILSISLSAEEPDSVAKLTKINRDITEGIHLSFWRWGELDEPRWRNLNDLIESRIIIAKDNTARKILRDMLSVAKNDNLKAPEKQWRNRSFRLHIIEKLERGELDRSNKELLFGVLEEMS